MLLDQPRQVVGERLAVAFVADAQVFDAVAGPLQCVGEAAHRREDAQHFLRMVANVVGLAAHLHEHVDDVGVDAAEPCVARIELVAEDQPQAGHRGASADFCRRQRSLQ